MGARVGWVLGVGRDEAMRVSGCWLTQNLIQKPENSPKNMNFVIEKIGLGKWLRGENHFSKLRTGLGFLGFVMDFLDFLDFGDFFGNFRIFGI